MFLLGCKERINTLQFAHQLVLDEKDARLDEKDARLNQILNITDTLSKKLDSTEQRLIAEWIFTKAIVAVTLVVFLAMVLLMVCLLTGRDNYTRRLETKIAKYEGMLEEKESHIRELEKKQAEASWTNKSSDHKQHPQMVAPPFVYAMPSPSPNVSYIASGDRK